MKSIFIVLMSVLLLSACVEEAKPSSDQSQRRQQEQLSKEANSQVGMPAIVNFQEKRMMKTIIELRDKAIGTITYTVDMNGKLHKLCDSIGYGLPYATQFTNPQKIAEQGHSYGYAILPQADPNGLFSPDSANGTWVLCLDPASKKTTPVYVEPNVIVSPFALN